MVEIMRLFWCYIEGKICISLQKLRLFIREVWDQEEHKRKYSWLLFSYTTYWCFNKLSLFALNIKNILTCIYWRVILITLYLKTNTCLWACFHKVVEPNHQVKINSVNWHKNYSVLLACLRRYQSRCPG